MAVGGGLFYVKDALSEEGSVVNVIWATPSYDGGLGSHFGAKRASRYSACFWNIWHQKKLVRVQGSRFTSFPETTICNCSSVTFAARTSASSRIAPVSVAPVRSAPCKFAPIKAASVSVAPVRLAPCK